MYGTNSSLGTNSSPGIGSTFEPTPSDSDSISYGCGSNSGSGSRKNGIITSLESTALNLVSLPGTAEPPSTTAASSAAAATAAATAAASPASAAAASSFDEGILGNVEINQQKCRDAQKQRFRSPISDEVHDLIITRFKEGSLEDNLEFGQAQVTSNWD